MKKKRERGGDERSGEKATRNTVPALAKTLVMRF